MHDSQLECRSFFPGVFSFLDPTLMISTSTYYIYLVYPILTEEGACDSALVKPAKEPEGNLALAEVYRAGCMGLLFVCLF